jgi:hypothetical protein
MPGPISSVQHGRRVVAVLTFLQVEGSSKCTSVAELLLTCPMQHTLSAYLLKFTACGAVALPCFAVRTPHAEGEADTPLLRRLWLPPPLFRPPLLPFRLSSSCVMRTAFEAALAFEPLRYTYAHKVM